MLDRIDERDKQERMHRSIVKYWNVNYIPTPYAEPKEEQTGEKEDTVTGISIRTADGLMWVWMPSSGR